MITPFSIPRFVTDMNLGMHFLYTFTIKKTP